MLAADARLPQSGPLLNVTVCETGSPFVQVTVPPELTAELFGVNAVAAAATCWPVPIPAAHVGVSPAGPATDACGAGVPLLPPQAAVAMSNTNPAPMPESTEIRTADSHCVFSRVAQRDA